MVVDTTVIDGTTYTVTFADTGSTDITHFNAGGTSETLLDVKTGFITLDDGSGSTLTYIIPIDDLGNVPDIGQIDISAAGVTSGGFINNITNSDTDDIVTLVCFASGTEIETAEGHLAVEKLRIGQMVQTMDHGLRPIRWIGRSSFAAHGNHAPIVIRKGAMGNARDLRVSPQHGMLIQGWQPELLFGHTDVFVAAKHLVNDDTIYIEEGGVVEYYHILFDQHEVIYAEGCPSESFHPGEFT